MSNHIESVVRSMLSGDSADGLIMTPPSGMALALWTSTFAHAIASGFADAGEETDTSDSSGTPMTLSTIHDLASVTKVLGTTTCLMRLVSENLLDLNVRVHRVIPEFGGGQKDSVTVRDLLLHRAGLWEWQPIYLGTPDRHEALAYAAALPLRYPRDQARHYSDLGFMLLGEIVARVTGLSLRHAVRELVTEPLGLRDTAYAPPGRTGVAASSYGDRAERQMVETQEPYPILDATSVFRGWRTGALCGEANDGNTFHAFDGVSGHAGLFSNIPDLGSYAIAMARIEEWDALFRPAVAREFFAAGPDEEQGLGFRRCSFDLAGRDVTLIGHPGFTGCAVGFIPDGGVGLAMVSNRLLTHGTPVSTHHLWESSKNAASADLKEHLE